MSRPPLLCQEGSGTPNSFTPSLTPYSHYSDPNNRDLEQHLHPELNNARPAFAEPWISGSDIRGLADCTKRTGVEIDVWKAEIRPVKSIENFSTKLYRSTLSHLCQLVH